MKRVGIIGGGIAGLSLSYFVGPDSEVLEKEDVCGGLCRSHEVDGFTFDWGGHILFSKDKEILDFELELLKDNVNQLYRRNTVWFKRRFVKYPFENGIGALDKEDIYDCLYNFLENPQRPQNTFEDWIYNTFGKGFADNYLIPYNTKIWKTPPSQMGTHWVERVPKPPAQDIIKSALGIETEGYTHQLHFWYPKEGGFQTLPRTFERHLGDRVVRGFPVTKVRRSAKGWIVSNGKDEREYERIVNTMPIYDFIKTLDKVPPEVQKAVDSLLYNSLVIVLVGLNRPRKIEMTSTYFPQPDLIFHRVVFHDYFGSNYAPPGCSSMVAEITAKEESDLWKMSDGQIAQETVNGLEREGFLEAKEVMTTAVRRTKYAYAIYDLHREKNLDIIYSWAKKEGIELCGRFAEFVYYNSDAVIRSAKTVAERINNEALQHA